MSIRQTLERVRKSSTDKWLGGVCGGIAAAFDLPAWLLRAVFLFFLLAYGSGLLIYLILWVCLPQEGK